MSYVAHIIMICPIPLLPQAALAASRITGNPEDAGDGGRAFFSVDVYPLDGTTPTHRLAAMPATAQTLKQLPALEAAFPGAAWTVWRNAGSRDPVIDKDQWLQSLNLRLHIEVQEEQDNG